MMVVSKGRLLSKGGFLLIVVPLFAGPPAYLLFHHRYGRPKPKSAVPTPAGQP